MVIVISQQTFNDAVQENINELGLSEEDAVEAAVSQFKAQGVDLSQIVTNPRDNAALQEIAVIINDLKQCLTRGALEECTTHLKKLKEECNKGLAQRVTAGKNGAYSVLLEVFQVNSGGKDLKLECLKTLIALMTRQPDLLDAEGRKLILSNLNSETDSEIQKFVLKWCRECCILHELNRQTLVEDNILEKLNVLLQSEASSNIRDVLALLRALVLDDDIRVEFGNAHEHAKLIANANLIYIMQLISKFKTDEAVINDLLLTTSSIMVRSELCKVVDEAGGIDSIHDIMNTFITSDKIIRQCFKVIKALAGNDECKGHVIQKGLAPSISNSLAAHKGTIPTAAAGLNCIAALSLRNPENSKALFEAAAPDVIVDVMKLHPNEKLIQKPASWAIRNMVSRSRYQNKHFLELGVEDILKEDLLKFKECAYDIKAALRDLECTIELNEEWTGTGGKISSESLLKPKE